jgi:hypothetical protein
MHTTHSPSHLRNAALAGLAVGGLTFGFVASACGGSATATPAASTSTASTPGTSAPAPVPAAVSAAVVNSHRSTKAATPAKLLSPNWAGPVLTGGVYDHATATVTVPQAKCSKTFTDSSFWVGLDGFTDGTVEQNGFDVACDAGQAYYLPWIEEYPAPPVLLQPAQFSVVPGDKVTVTVTANAGTNAGTDTFTFDNATSGTSFTASATAAQGAQGASAECIAEAPGEGYTGKFTQLTDFGQVDFTQCEAQVASTQGAACNLVTAQGCPTGSHLVDDNIGSRKHHVTRVHAATMATGDGGFVVTWHHV